MTDNLSDFGRRSVLLGLGAVGVTTAGAGFGTTAYERDEESLDSNQLATGDLDLAVHYEFFRDQGRRDEPGGIGRSLRDEGVLGAGSYGHDADEDSEADRKKQKIKYNISDIKPGDSGFLRFCFSIVDNDALLWNCGTIRKEVGGVGGGHLADYLQATLYYCDADTDKEGKIDPESVLVAGSLRDVFDALSKGVPLDADGNTDDGDGSLPLDDRACFPGTNSHKTPHDTCVCLRWRFPIRSVEKVDDELVNNDVKGAALRFSLEFTAEQCRYNDGAQSPCSDQAYGGA
ncbi:MAG: hypothetical protein ACQETB_13480 [Halobacteriota archaeon]